MCFRGAHILHHSADDQKLGIHRGRGAQMRQYLKVVRISEIVQDVLEYEYGWLVIRLSTEEVMAWADLSFWYDQQRRYVLWKTTRFELKSSGECPSHAWYTFISSALRIVDSANLCCSRHDCRLVLHDDLDVGCMFGDKLGRCPSPTTHINDNRTLRNRFPVKLCET
jgi:hypothetical protein